MRLCRSLVARSWFIIFRPLQSNTLVDLDADLVIVFRTCSSGRLALCQIMSTPIPTLINPMKSSEYTPWFSCFLYIAEHDLGHGFCYTAQSRLCHGVFSCWYRPGGTSASCVSPPLFSGLCPPAIDVLALTGLPVLVPGVTRDACSFVGHRHAKL